MENHKRPLKEPMEKGSGPTSAFPAGDQARRKTPVVLMAFHERPIYIAQLQLHVWENTVNSIFHIPDKLSLLVSLVCSFGVTVGAHNVTFGYFLWNFFDATGV